MKIVIDIPKEMYERIKDGYVPLGISKYLKNGKPLPKKHGDLVDRDAVRHAYDYSDMGYTMVDALEDAQPVIEADYGEKEGEEK